MSPAPIDTEQVKQVAKLARLAMDDAQALRLSSQLEAILGYIDQIGELNVDAVEPMTRAGTSENVLRDDIVEPSLTVDQVLQNAPATDGAFFKVPKILGAATEDSAG